jgi:signal transduction histidine kinase
MAAYKQRLLAEGERLAAWPSLAGKPLLDAIRDSLTHAGHVVDAPRVVLIWDEPGEPPRLAWWAHGEFGAERPSPEHRSSIVIPSLEGCDFLCRDVPRDDAEVLYTDGDVLKRWRGRPLGAAFVERFAIRSVVALRLEGTGRLFLLNKPRPTTDDVQAGRIVAHQVMASLKHALSLQKSQALAAASERMRLAQDLHDGILQSLTALSLRLEEASHTVNDAMRTHIERILRRLEDEQRRLRLFASERGPSTPITGSPQDFTAGLRQLTGQLARDWGIEIALSLGGGSGLDDLSGPITQDVDFILREAVSNAARHGGASIIVVDVTREPNHLRLAVSDNGRGFSFTGRYSEGELRANETGPVSLRQRVERAGGHLTIDSSPTGARLDIELPLHSAGR